MGKDTATMALLGKTKPAPTKQGPRKFKCGSSRANQLVSLAIHSQGSARKKQFRRKVSKATAKKIRATRVTFSTKPEVRYYTVQSEYSGTETEVLD